jgi:hypothetical protein
MENQKTYDNSNLEEMEPEFKKWIFSKGKWFDILF